MILTKLEKLETVWHKLPEWVKPAAWIGLSAAITAVGSYILEQPELFQYYGVTNFILFFIKELNKKRRGK